MRHSDNTPRPTALHVEAPDKLTDWDPASLVPPPRDEHEEALAVATMERVLSEMLYKGRLTPLEELPILVGKFRERDLKDLAYRAVTDRDRKDAYAAIDARATSLSEKLIGHLAISCIHEYQTPRSVDWRELRSEFEATWSAVKSELFNDLPAKRAVAQRWTRFALDKLRLPTSIRGEFSLVPDALRGKVEEALEWSLELRQ